MLHPDLMPLRFDLEDPAVPSKRIFIENRIGLLGSHEALKSNPVPWAFLPHAGAAVIAG